MIEAIACENPYPARWFTEAAFNQMILRCLSRNLSLARVEGLASRVTPTLGRLVTTDVEARRAAGRPVPTGVELVLRNRG